MDCTHLTRPRLVSTNGEHGVYLALSYVWGQDQVHKTTNTNVSAYKHGIDPRVLPQTIRDAIYVTHTLGFKYLWVDSLCILQDSKEDKLHEIGHMHHIYRYAHLTIMAASAKDISEGFLQERLPPSDIDSFPFICPPSATISTGSPEDLPAGHPQVGTISITPVYSDITHGSYSHSLGRMATRAWCMQESLMSPRALIFTPGTLLFRCLFTVPTQGVGNSLYRIRDEPRIPNLLFSNLLSPLAASAAGSNSYARWKEMHIAWMVVLEDYTCRTASDESDKLVACAAIAEQFHRVLDSDYLAGLWRGRSDMDLAHLLWTADKNKAKSLGRRHALPAAYRALSWSWAAIKGPIDQYYPRALTSGEPELTTAALAEVVECWVTLKDPTLRFGRVTDGALIMHGTLILCRGGLAQIGSNKSHWFVPLPSFEDVWYKWQRGLRSLIPDDENSVHSTDLGDGVILTMDCNVDELLDRMWLVPFVHVRRGSEEEHFHGLALQLAAPTSASSGTGLQDNTVRFRRIGHFRDLAKVARHGKRFRVAEHSLWHPLLQAVKDGEPPWTNIVIV